MLVGEHDADDFRVGQPHALGGQAVDVADGALHAFAYNAVASHKLAALAVHPHAQPASLHGGSDFCGAARPGAGAADPGARYTADCTADGAVQLIAEDGATV